MGEQDAMVAAGPPRFDAPDVVAELVRRRQTVATAESLTGGGVCAQLTSVPGASEVVRGGLIVYAADLKTSLVGVPDDLIEEKGTVDADVALLLAEGARDKCRADWGIGLTGVAGPGPGERDIPAGTVYLAVVGPDTASCRKLLLSGDRDEVRAKTCRHAFQLLMEHLRASERCHQEPPRGCSPVADGPRTEHRRAYRDT